MESIRNYENEIGENLLRGLMKLPDLRVYGIKDPGPGRERTPTFGVRHARRSPAELAAKLGENGFFTWNGHFYALNLSERLGLEPSGGMLRIGLAHYNTADEVDRLLAELSRI